MPRYYTTLGHAGGQGTHLSAVGDTPSLLPGLTPGMSPLIPWKRLLL